MFQLGVVRRLVGDYSEKNEAESETGEEEWFQRQFFVFQHRFFFILVFFSLHFNKREQKNCDFPHLPTVVIPIT